MCLPKFLQVSYKKNKQAVFIFFKEDNDLLLQIVAENNRCYRKFKFI